MSQEPFMAYQETNDPLKPGDEVIIRADGLERRFVIDEKVPNGDGSFHLTGHAISDLGES